MLRFSINIGGLNHFHSSRYVYSKVPSLFSKEEFRTSSFNATPNFVRDLYNVTGRGEAFLNKQVSDLVVRMEFNFCKEFIDLSFIKAIVEFLGESMNPGDLIAFMDNYGRNFTHYNGVDGILGLNTPDNPGLTANLDAQYIMSIGELFNYYVVSTIFIRLLLLRLIRTPDKEYKYRRSLGVRINEALLHVNKLSISLFEFVSHYT